MTNQFSNRHRLGALAATVGLALSACGSDGAGDSAAPDDAATGSVAESGSTDAPDAGGEDVTIEWWHIQNNDPALSNWQSMADAYMEMNPNVTIDITVMENEAFKAALQTNLQSGDVPDLFQSWGGGGLRDQAEAGLVRDITDMVGDINGQFSPSAAEVHQVDGKQYGVAYNASVTGLWYNKDLFAEAGLDAPAATWEEFLTQVQTLQDAGITPIAVGAGDKWPAHFWYSYLMLREGGADVMNEIAATNDFDVPAVVDAGARVATLVDLEPFQEGFLAAGWDAPDGESGTMASQNAAMDLMGPWAEGAFKTQAGVEPDQDLPWNIGWAPFPAVEGGAGDAGDVLGGADGFAVGKDAPDEAIDFLAFITNEENQELWASTGQLPVNLDAVDAVTDENQKAALAALNDAPFIQLFLDQFFTAEVGSQINDQTALLFAGQTSPEDAASAITATAGG